MAMMAVDKPERLMKAISIEHFSPRLRSLIYAFEQEKIINIYKYLYIYINRFMKVMRGESAQR